MSKSIDNVKPEEFFNDRLREESRKICYGNLT